MKAAIVEKFSCLNRSEPSDTATACLRLGGDPTDDEYPDKPPRMRWATYNRLMDRLVAADGVVDERLRLLGIDAERAFG